MNFKKISDFHFSHNYTYFVTITTNYKYDSTEKIYEKFRKYIYHYDNEAHIKSVKEFTKNLNGLHYHILVFTNKKLDYSRVHMHMPPHSDIRIELVPKTEDDIKKVYKYMRKSKKHKKIS